jgi:predicted TIM-barrel fold metal-dependent hydrolase
MVSKYPNVHIGMAGMPTRKLPALFPNMEQLQDRFIFGSDWPGMPDVKGLIDRVLKLPLSDKAKEKMLGGNARRVLDLP